MGLIKKMGLAKTGQTNVGNEDATGGNGVTTAIAMLQAQLAASDANLELAGIQESLNDVSALERIQGRLEGLVARIGNVAVDGLTQREAILITDSVDEINAELGEDLLEMPANEAFGDKISAKNFTNLGLEAADGALAKVWQFIIDTINKIKDMFAKWWTQFFNAVEKMKAYAAKVKASAANYKDDREEKNITLKGGALYVGTTKPTATSIVAGMAAVGKSVPGFVEKHITVTEAITEGLVKALGNMDGVEAKQKSAVEAIAGVAGIADYLEGKFDSKPDVDGVVFGSDIMGGKTVNVENKYDTALASDNTAGRKAFLDALGKVSYKVVSSKGKFTDVKTPRLTQAQVETVADAAIDAAKDIIALRKSREDSRKLADDVAKAAAEAKKESENLDDAAKANKGELTAGGKAALNLLKAVSGGAVSGWTAHIVTTSNAALKAAEASI